MVINSHFKASTSSNLRQYHRSLILSEILAEEGISRVMLAERTGLSQMALSRIARELIDAGLIDESGKHNRRNIPGRRQTGLQICPTGGYTVGLVISGYGHQVVLSNSLGEPVLQQDFIIEDLSDPALVIRASAEAVSNIVGRSGCEKNRVLGVGVAISAVVAADNRTVSGALNFGWEPLDFGRLLENETGLPVIVEKIADAVSLAESLQQSTDDNSVLFLVHAATMLGASIIQNGAIVRNASGSAGQIGHMLIEPGDRFCFCGRQNCLNTRASGWSVLVQLGLTGSNSFSADDIESTAKAVIQLIKADPATETEAGQALFEAGKCLAAALQNTCLMIAPSAFVLAGALSESAAYMEGFKSVWEDFSQAYSGLIPPVQTGNIPASQAASLIALHTFLYSPALQFNEHEWLKGQSV